MPNKIIHKNPWFEGENFFKKKLRDEIYDQGR